MYFIFPLYVCVDRKTPASSIVTALHRTRQTPGTGASNVSRRSAKTLGQSAKVNVCQFPCIDPQHLQIFNDNVISTPLLHSLAKVLFQSERSQAKSNTGSILYRCAQPNEKKFPKIILIFI